MKLFVLARPHSSESYLRIDRIISAAEMTDSDAIHPGYGFLAENAHFASVCRDCEIEFIGPSPEAMGLLGDKINCKRLAKKAGTPIFPGTDGEIEELDEAVKVASEIGYPVIVKATAGGGGKGMRIARNVAGLRTAVTAAQQEAIASFGNGAVYLEKFFRERKAYRSGKYLATNTETPYIYLIGIARVSAGIRS